MNLAVRVLCLMIGVSLACAVVGEDKAAARSQDPQESQDLPESLGAVQQPASVNTGAMVDTPASAGERASSLPGDDAAPVRRREKTADRQVGSQHDGLLLLFLQLLRSPK